MPLPTLFDVYTPREDVRKGLLTRIRPGGSGI